MSRPGGERPTSCVRVPAEWEPRESVWLTWPHNRDTWPTSGLPAARAAFARFAAALTRYETVDLIVADAATRTAASDAIAAAGGRLESIRFHRFATNDSWVRDTAPIWLVDPGGRRRATLWTFNAWGGKYPPWDEDAATGQRIAEAAGDAVDVTGVVLEGGSVEFDGRGTVLTTRSCLLNANRSPGRTAGQMEAVLARWLGAREVVWLDAGIAGDDTDGHIDDIARFGPGGVVLTGISTNPEDPNEHRLRRNAEALADFCSRTGRTLVPLPMPQPLVVAGDPLPATYLNFLSGPRAIYVPSFGDRSDAEAAAVLGCVFADRDVISVNCRVLVEGLGGLHCLSAQMPERRRRPAR